jgi:tetratricopeptide (TPR) repeat protein
MKTKPPPQRRKFADARDEMDYIYHKLLYWLYAREDRGRARTFAERLARLLIKVAPGHDAIFPEECWSLICEARENLLGAIKHRENEVRLIRKLHKLSRNTPQEKLITKMYGYDDLGDRLDLLAELYHDSGQIDKAIETLHESWRLSTEHGVPFDGADLLREYQHARQSQKNATVVGSSAEIRSRRVS